MKKNLLIFPILIITNLILFVIFVKIAKNNIKQSGKISIVVFDPVSEFFVSGLSANTNSLEISNVFSYLNKTQKLSFYEQNKIRTSNAVIAFDPSAEIQKLFNIEPSKLFDFSAQIIYYDDFTKAKNINELMGYGFLNSSANLKALLTYLTATLKNLDPQHKNQYEANFFELSKQISNVFATSTENISRFTERAINIVIIGSQATKFLQDVNFWGVVDISSPITAAKINNLTNIVKSGSVNCVIDVDFNSSPEIYKILKMHSVKYYRYNIYSNFSLQNYLQLSNVISKCFTKK